MHSIFGFHLVFTTFLCIVFGVKIFIVPHGGIDQYTLSSSKSVLKQILLIYLRFIVISKKASFVVASEAEKEQVKLVFRRLDNSHILVVPWPVADSSEIIFSDKYYKEEKLCDIGANAY